MLMMMHRTSANLDDDLPTIHHHHHQILSDDQEQSSIIINSTCQISWKLYDNPIFSTTNTSISTTTSPLKLKPKQLQRKYSASAKFVHHHIHSDHKMSNNGVSSPKSNSSSDYVGYHNQLNQAKTQVAELKAELEMERKFRKKMEALNKKLSKELVDQTHQKERVSVCDCEDLMKEISRLKEEMEKMKKEMEEERKMLRMAEVLREERVQMKLADAHMFYHHNVLNQFLLQQEKNPTSVSSEESKKFTSSSSTEQKCLNVTTAAATSGCISGSVSGKNVIRKASPEPENPHIKQGIKGFVEFQRAIKAKNGSNYPSNYSSGNSSKQSKDNIGGFNKVECQKAQLRVLFKQKYPLPYSQHDHLIIS